MKAIEDGWNELNDEIGKDDQLEGLQGDDRRRSRLAASIDPGAAATAPGLYRCAAVRRRRMHDAVRCR